MKYGAKLDFFLLNIKCNMVVNCIMHITSTLLYIYICSIYVPTSYIRYTYVIIVLIIYRFQILCTYMYLCINENMCIARRIKFSVSRCLYTFTPRYIPILHRGKKKTVFMYKGSVPMVNKTLPIYISFVLYMRSLFIVYIYIMYSNRADALSISNLSENGK